MPSWITHPVVLLSVGGAAGTNARYWLGQWVAQHGWARSFPFATLIINVSGSLLLGVFAVLFLERLPTQQRQGFLLLGVGFCGGYTTFSTFAFETFALVRQEKISLALVYVLTSVAASFLVVVLAVHLTEKATKP